MEKTNVIVSTVLRFNPPLDRPVAELLRAERGVSVELEGGRLVRLDPDNPRSPGLAKILDGMLRLRAPVYVELDPGSTVVSRVFIPHVTRVTRIRPIDRGVLGIELDLSQGRHVLRQSVPDFGELEQQLRLALKSRAPMVITENDDHEIIDAREYAPGPEGLPFPFPPLPRPEIVARIPCILWIWRWPCWPWWWFRCVSPAKAQETFDAMSATSCDPLTVPPPCIPFLYPDDGCWGRAHEMARLMIARGLNPKKVWIEGGLYVSTRNNPNCGVWWGWHVAPTLCVRGPGFCQHRDMVIDPSLFTTPVTKETWKDIQNDPSATLTMSSASIFYLWGSMTDPTYVQTNQVLATYRLRLQNRSLQIGPPPYANCP